MNKLKILFLLSLFCSAAAVDCYAEISAAKSVELLTMTSKVAAVGKIVRVEKVKGQYAVVYENYVLQVSENIKGAKRVKELKFTIRAFSTYPIFGKVLNVSDEVVVFLQHYKGDEDFLKSKLVPTSDSFPLSVINSESPARHIIDTNFNVLTTKEGIVRTAREGQRKLDDFRKQNPKAEVKGYYVEVPMSTKAFGELYAGSSCFLQVPNFMFPNSRETIRLLLTGK